VLLVILDQATKTGPHVGSSVPLMPLMTEEMLIVSVVEKPRCGKRIWDKIKMNNQKKNKEAEIILKNNNLSYYAWPQTFSSSAGPYRGNIVGCNSFTTITVEAYVEPSTKKAVLFCLDRRWCIIENFDIQKAISEEYNEPFYICIGEKCEKQIV
jgi:hypothetical protein